MGAWSQFILGSALVLLIVPLIGKGLGLGFGWLWLIKGVYHAFAPTRKADYERRNKRRGDTRDSPRDSSDGE